MSDASKEEWQTSLKELKQVVEEGDYEEAAKLCPSLIASTPDDSDAQDVKAALYETYCKSLLHLKEYQKVVDIFQQQQKQKDNNKSMEKRLRTVHLYALYRLEQFDEARELCQDTIAVDTADTTDESDNIALQHIHAQSLFHLAATKDAVKEYQRLLAAMSTTDINDNRRMEVFTNLTATLVANATPYVRSTLDEELEDLRQQMQAFLSTNSDSEEYPYDLAYNLATWELMTNALELHRWTDLLAQAVRACTVQNKDTDDDDDLLQRELAPIATNLQWSRDFWAGTATTVQTQGQQKLPAAVQAVQKLNLAFGAPGSEGLQKTLPEHFDSKLNLTPLQKRINQYNRAILQLRDEKTSECRKSCQSLLGSLQKQSLSNTQKKKQKQLQSNNGSHVVNQNQQQQPTASLVDGMWWESRILVLQALCGKRDGQALDETKKSLQAMMDKLLEMEPTAVRDHALLYLQLHTAAILGDDNAGADDDSKAQKDNIQATIDLLQELPESIRSRKAVTASLASIYHQQGKEHEAEQLLQETGDDQSLAEFAMSQGNYADAAALYEKAAAEAQDAVATARWVHALSFVDPDRAQKMWSEAKASQDLVLVDDQDSDVNGAELEARELPRLKTSKARKTDALAIDDGPKKTKKSHEAVLRMRERKREEYLAGLQKKGLYRVDRPSKPDPERWLPKFERSYARRRRNRGGPHKGAQGGVSEKDAAKLDVMARQVARASGEPDSLVPSTAHMTVTAAGGGGRKAGKRR
jgi:tetratricopeptide (TPR) repeat protein